MQETKENVIGVKITGREKKEIQNLINSGLFLSFSDFLRNALRDKLEEIKIIKIGAIDHEQAKKEVLGYYKRYNEAYPYEVANDLELDSELVFGITEELKKEGRLE